MAQSPLLAQWHRMLVQLQLGLLKSDADNDLKRPSSFAALGAAFVPALASALLFLSIFVLIRPWFRRLYSPRTYIDSINEKDRTPASSSARIAWVKTLAHLGDKFLLEHSSLDAYLYLRFLRTIITICVVGTLITWPILMPINAAGGGDASELDRLGFGNVDDPRRFYVHAVVAWIFYGYVMFLIARERIWLVGVRQAWYTSRANAGRLSSRTVLYLDPPADAPQNDNVQSHFGQKAEQQWIVVPTSNLDSAVSKRNSTLQKLEGAQVEWISHVARKKRGGRPSQDVINSLRPRHRTHHLLGDQADSITVLRSKATDLIQEVDTARASYSADAKRGRSAIFVAYENQAAAQRAYKEKPKSQLPMPTVQSRLIGVTPKDIIWSSLTMTHAARLSAMSFGNALIITLIVVWSIPSSFIGSIASISYLKDNVEWLGWLSRLPDSVIVLLSSLVPPLVTSALSSYVPIGMRYVAKKSGEPTSVSAELQVQTWYYIFQVTQVFLVTALSSAAMTFVPELLQNPTDVPKLLANNLPSSSNFYVTYFVLQGLAFAAKNVLNYSDLLQYLFYQKYINKTPRAKYDQYVSLKGISWGKVYPKFTNFAIVALAYSCISPLVTGFAALGLCLFYLSYRYNLTFVMQPKLETMGKCYTRALQQILAGVYIGELCLIGLLGLRSAKGPLAMLVVLFVATIAYNVTLIRYLGPLEDHLPEKLLRSDSEAGEEQDPLLAAEQGEGADLDEQSRVHRLGRELHIPSQVRSLAARFLEPHIYASHRAMTAFLAGLDLDLAADPPSYTQEALRTAYLNPSLTSKPPRVWLPRDRLGLSKEEIQENGSVDIATVDDGAWLADDGNVQFAEDNLRSLPTWKDPVPY
ncbi:calcium permeable stress-gated cation channel [Microdochium nivale]|nr:calcium permeable stress-gated cation channel [Microdochium nivale]